jgi:hypothetical protein
MIEHHFTNSSAINWCRYESITKELEVCFTSGSTYSYSNVPSDVVDGLCRAPSAGKYFHAYIAHAFPYTSDNQSGWSNPIRPVMTVAAPLARPECCHYSSKDKGAFSPTLVAFETFRNCIQEYCKNGSDILAFNRFLKDKKNCSRLRSNARTEFQNIYIAVALEVGLPKLSVFLPTRKKVSVMGLARTVSGTPEEIRLYTIHGPGNKDYSSWMVSDMRIDDSSNACETLVHEMAHIHEAHFHRVLGHDQTFIEGYLEIERIFLGLGFEGLLLTRNRFTGCPSASKASTLSGIPRSAQQGAGGNALARVPQL